MDSYLVLNLMKQQVSYNNYNIATTNNILNNDMLNNISINNVSNTICVYHFKINKMLTSKYDFFINTPIKNGSILNVINTFLKGDDLFSTDIQDKNIFYTLFTNIDVTIEEIICS